jgi:hypothetical protein
MMSARSFREAGWVWEGQGFDPDVPPSIYGVGEGATYFGLDRCNLIFHPNNEITLGKLADKAEVVADISKWKFIEMPRQEGVPGGVGFRNWRDSNPDTVVEEARKLSRLSVDFPNVVGAMIDDTGCMLNYEQYTSSIPEAIREALDSANPDLKLWIVVYGRQLDEDYWAAFADYVDVIHLWEGHPHMLVEFPAYVEHCEKVFPGKQIIIGSYLRNYTGKSEVPTKHVAEQYEIMYRLWQEGRIAGFSILANCLIDRHPEQAEWIRDFIADH